MEKINPKVVLTYAKNDRRWPKNVFHRLLRGTRKGRCLYKIRKTTRNMMCKIKLNLNFENFVNKFIMKALVLLAQTFFFVFK